MKRNAAEIFSKFYDCEYVVEFDQNLFVLQIYLSVECISWFDSSCVAYVILFLSWVIVFQILSLCLKLTS